MGRPGTGGSSGGGSFGGHSSGRTSGGHRIGGGSGGSRPGINHSSGSYHRTSCHGGGYYRGPMFFGRGPYHHGNSWVGLLVIAIVLLSMVFSNITNSPKSTVNRKKLENPVAYTNNCIVDELGWIENPQKLSKELQGFYKKTGIQPYIVLEDYDSSLTTDAEKEAYANEYYHTQIDNEGTFLYMYFAEPNDSDVGYMAYVNGKSVTSVMDAEAVNIFWNYLDRYWVDENLTMTDVFAKTFEKTADTIMTKSTTGKDIVKYVLILTVVISIGVVIYILRQQKRKLEKERAEETERILNTPLDNDTEDLKNKYL